jgi:outer membrane protein OmpA-like peptidoglycan-associated protein
LKIIFWERMMRKNILAVSSLIIAMTLAGCTTTDPYTGESQTSNTAKGVGIGAIGGALAGALIGGGKAQGILIGAAAGAAIGGGIGHYQDEQEAQLRQQLQGTGVQVQRNGNNIKLIMPGNITFANNSADINGAFYQTLNSVVIVLKKYDETMVKVAGYASSTGSASANLLLSQQRAASVSNYLQMQGIAPARLANVGYGASNFISSDTTAAANRRVEINLIPNQQ